MRGKDWLEPLFEANRQLLRRAGPVLTPVQTGHVPLDVDVFVMDNSDSRKEGVGRTYLGVDGYAPIAAYLGGEGYLLELSLRPGRRLTRWSGPRVPAFAPMRGTHCAHWPENPSQAGKSAVQRADNRVHRCADADFQTTNPAELTDARQRVTLPL